MERRSRSLILLPVWVLELLGWNRSVKHRRRAVGAETLIGREALVTTACRPNGQVRLDGELWEARCEAGADAGETVTVVRPRRADARSSRGSAGGARRDHPERTMIAAARAATVGRMEIFWTIMAYAFVLGLGALGGLVTLLWLNAAKLRADARRPSGGPGPQAREPEPDRRPARWPASPRTERGRSGYGAEPCRRQSSARPAEPNRRLLSTGKSTCVRWEPLSAVRIAITVDGALRRMRSAASTPVIPGMRWSTRTSSGRSDAASSTASSPELPVAASSNPGVEETTSAAASRKTRLSSTRTTRTGGVTSRRERLRRAVFLAPTGSGA